MLSEVVAPLGEVVDDIAFVHNMVGKTGVHSQGTLLQSTGFNRPGFPGMGCWVSYGLGSMNENLPTFVVLPDHRGLGLQRHQELGQRLSAGPASGDRHLSRAPKPHRRPVPGPARRLHHPRQRRRRHRPGQSHQPRRTPPRRAGDDRLEARIRSYELAARMQLAAPEALDLSERAGRTSCKLYGLDHGRTTFDKEINPLEETDYFGRKCLVARRLLERGVRFVQIWSGNDNGFPRRNWDSHEDVKRDHGPLAFGMARGAAALIQDLKQRGLLDDTIILWTTEFGRMPSSQGGSGRDHNPVLSSPTGCAAAASRAGISYGPSDELGYKPLDRKNPTQVYDIHATILHLLGIDHTRLTVRHNGIDRRLTDVHGHVIKELLA